MIAYVQNKQVHQKAPQSSTSGVVTPKEHELGQRLQKQNIEISRLHACYEQEISKKNREIKGLHSDCTTLRKAVEKKDRDMLELRHLFREMQDENHQMVEQMQRRHNTVLSHHRNQQENNKLLQHEADARARVLQEKLTTAEEELELCRDDLFRTQPVCQISDASIVDAFDSLGEQLVNWIDDQVSAFEYANPNVDVGYLFSTGKDLKMAKILLKYPSAGEYLCRHIVNRYLLEHTFGSDLHLFGVSAEYTHMLATIKQGMAAVRPQRDSQRIDIWRAETLTALAATQGYSNLKEEQSRRVTTNLFECLAATFPNLDAQVEARRDLHEQMTVPAMAIVSKLQGLASTFSLDMASGNFLDRRRITKDDLKRVTAIDLKTGKTVKHGSAIVGDRHGAIGDFVLALEPGLRRVREGGSAIDLRKEIWLVRLDDSL